MMTRRYSSHSRTCPVLGAALVVTTFVSAPVTLQARDVTITVHTLIGPNAPFTDGISLAADGSLLASDALGSGSLSNPQGTVISRIAPDLTITTHADGLNVPMDNVLDEEGNLYVTNWFGVVNKILPDGTVTVLANITNCAGIERDSQGNIYVSRAGYNQIRKITPQGGVSIYYSGPPLNAAIGLAIDGADNLYVANFADGKIHRIPAANPSTAEFIAQVPDPVSGCIGFMAYRDGRLYVPGYHTCRVYMVEVDSGELTVLAGTGVPGRVDGPGESAQFYQPNGVEVSASGDTLYITDDVDRTLRIIVMDEDPTGIPDPLSNPGRRRRSGW